MLCYYNSIATLSIKYTSNCKDANIDNLDYVISLATFSNSAYSNNSEHKSSIGYVIKIASGVVLYKAYRQRLITLFSTELEYIALTYAAKEVN
jgi:hypothetical protein